MGKSVKAAMPLFFMVFCFTFFAGVHSYTSSASAQGETYYLYNGGLHYSIKQVDALKPNLVVNEDMKTLVECDVLEFQGGEHEEVPAMITHYSGFGMTLLKFDEENTNVISDASALSSLTLDVAILGAASLPLESDGQFIKIHAVNEKAGIYEPDPNKFIEITNTDIITLTDDEILSLADDDGKIANLQIEGKIGNGSTTCYLKICEISYTLKGAAETPVEEPFLNASYKDGFLNIEVKNAPEGYLFQYWIKQSVSVDGNTSNINNHITIWSKLTDFTADSSTKTDIKATDYPTGELYHVLVRLTKDGKSGGVIYAAFSADDLNIPRITSISVEGGSGEEVIAVYALAANKITVKSNQSDAVYRISCGGERVAEDKTDGIFNLDLSGFSFGEHTFTAEIENSAGSNSVDFKLFIYGEYDAKNIVVIDGINVPSYDAKTNTVTFELRLKKASGDAVTPQELEEDFSVSLFCDGVYIAPDSQFVSYDDDGGLIARYSAANYLSNGIFCLTGRAVRNADRVLCDRMVYYYHFNTRGESMSVGYVSSETDQTAITASSTVTITANAVIDGSDENILYAFFREDAGGWTAVRGYDTDNVLVWKPGRAGRYNISVRAKVMGGMSYEIERSLELTVSGNAADGEVTLELCNLDGESCLSNEVVAGQPYKLAANYTGGDDVLYLFTVYTAGEKFAYLNKYSVNNYHIFIPKKPDIYYITVRVIAAGNGGYRDINSAQLVLLSV